jgi:putative DNA primase/helicase
MTVGISLGERLEAELPGILLWAIEGLRRLKAHGKFVQPESSAMLIRHFEMASSPALAFVTDCCVLEPEAVVTKDALYNAYTQWQSNEGRTYVLDKNTFSSKLYSAFPGIITEGRPRTDGKRTRVFYGVRLPNAEEMKTRDM